MFTKDSSFEENEAALSKLSKVQCVHFSVHVARSVLHIWEELYPYDMRPRKAIEAAEHWLIDKDAASSAAGAARAAWAAANTAWASASAANAARAAWAAANTAWASASAANAAWASASAANAAWASANAALAAAWAGDAARVAYAAASAGQKCEWISKLYSSIHKEQPFPNHWKTRDTVSIAKDVLTSRNLNDMPILADALEDAGCTDAEILNHLRNDEGLWTFVNWVLLNLGDS